MVANPKHEYKKYMLLKEKKIVQCRFKWTINLFFINTTFKIVFPINTTKSLLTKLKMNEEIISYYDQKLNLPIQYGTQSKKICTLLYISKIKNNWMNKMKIKMNKSVP